jgi:predicted nuclease of predicted toxin-antitoxin system
MPQSEDKNLPKLLIDENLSPTLEGIAHERGYECAHVFYLGLSGTKDWELKHTILDGDWTFITANGVDFRGPANAPGTNGELRGRSATRWPHLCHD